MSKNEKPVRVPGEVRNLSNPGIGSRPIGAPRNGVEKKQEPSRTSPATASAAAEHEEKEN